MKYNLALLKADILDEMRNLEKLSGEFPHIEKLLSLEEKQVTFFDKAAVGYFLHTFYNGSENIFTLVAKFFENDVGPQTWHSDLLKRMKLEIPGYRPALIDEDLYYALNEFRAFRHVFRHAYSFHLDWGKIKILASKYPVTFQRFSQQVEIFLQSLEVISDADSS